MTIYAIRTEPGRVTRQFVMSHWCPTCGAAPHTQCFKANRMGRRASIHIERTHTALTTTLKAVNL